MAAPRLDRSETQLLIIDIQERLCSAMPDERLSEVLGRTSALLEGARTLGLPISATEQYPKGLGPTLSLLRDRLDPTRIVEKVEFSALVPQLEGLLLGRRQVLVAGMETHICVFQTIRDLSRKGFQPLVCADAVLSRNETDYRIGLDLCREAGANITTVETCLFDLLGRAGTPEFKAVSAAVK